jgi:hypothetical protein
MRQPNKPAFSHAQGLDAAGCSQPIAPYVTYAGVWFTSRNHLRGFARQTCPRESLLHRLANMAVRCNQNRTYLDNREWLAPGCSDVSLRPDARACLPRAQVVVPVASARPPYACCCTYRTSTTLCACWLSSHLCLLDVRDSERSWAELELRPEMEGRERGGVREKRGEGEARHVRKARGSSGGATCRP